MSNQHVSVLSTTLANTGLIEVVKMEEQTTPMEHDELVTMTVLMRLRPRVMEKDWVFKIVRPIRELSWRYPGKWRVRTAKEYVDKESDNQKGIAYTFIIEVTTPNPQETNSAVAHALRTGSPAAPESAEGSPILTLAEMPDEIIERPLVGAGADRNASQLRPSAYAHITGQAFKAGAGARSVLNKK